MSTVLVTGGAGFVGSHVVDALLDEGHQVLVLDDLSTGDPANLRREAQLFELDIGDARVRELFERERIHVVIHHAAKTLVRRSVADPAGDARVNIQGLLNLLQCIKKTSAKGIVFASSGGAVYGEPEGEAVSERAPKGPLSPYGVSKLASEHYLYCYHRVFGLPSISLRYGNVYGPRQNPHGEAGVVAIFSEQMLRGEPPTIFGDGEQERDYVYVEDVVRTNLLAMKKLLAGISAPRSVDDYAYNIGTGAGTSVNALFARLARITGFSGQAKHGPARLGEVRRIRLDVSKAKAELGWTPRVDLEEGLQRTVAFFQRGGGRPGGG